MSDNGLEKIGEVLSHAGEHLGNLGIDKDVIPIVAVPGGYYFGALFFFLGGVRYEVVHIMVFLGIAIIFFGLFWLVFILGFYLADKLLGGLDNLTGRKETIFAYVSFTVFALLVNLFAVSSVLTYRFVLTRYSRQTRSQQIHSS
jgi:hypothetical protein